MDITKILAIDFETQDPYIKRRLGAGHVFGYNIENSDFEVCGCAIRHIDGKYEYTQDMKLVLDLVQTNGNFLAHNAGYEFGILHFLKKKLNHSIDLDNIQIYDTKIMFKMFDNTLESYSLDYLSKKFLNKPKGHETLIDSVKKLDIYPYTKKEMKERLAFERDNPGQIYIRKEINPDKLLDFAYTHMNLLHKLDLQSVAKYAILDIEETWELFIKVHPHLSESLLKDVSDIIKCVNSYRFRGMKINLNEASILSKELEQIIIKDYTTLTGEVTTIDNMKLINSNKQLTELFSKKGIKLPKIETINEETGILEEKISFDKKFLRSSKNEIVSLIATLRQNMKLKSSFVDKLIEYQEYTNNNSMIYPEIIPWAAKTSRFSSNSPNIQQQIPEVRRIFVPNNPNEKLYALDFSNQEGRILIHYAKLLNCPGIDEVIQLFLDNPAYDLHTRIGKIMFEKSEITKEERSIAKTIFLGKSYGMGKGKLANTLDITEQKAEDLTYSFYEACPFLKPLMKLCEASYKKNGYIRTLKGQKMRLEEIPVSNGMRVIPYYKALNLLIQSNAAEQCREAMIQAYKRKLPVIACIHDELLMSGTLEQALELKEIMENCVKLVIPCVTTIKEGSTWLECSK